MKLKLSVRFWQTVVFWLITLSAMFIVYTILSSSIRQSIEAVPQSQLERDRAYLAEDISGDFLTVAKGGSSNSLKERVRRFARTFDEDVSVFNTKGELVFSQRTYTYPDNLLKQALRTGLNQREFVRIDLQNKIGIASQPVVSNGRWLGIVIVGSNETKASELLTEAKGQLRIALLVALLVAGFLGWIFAEIITKQIRSLTEGALAIAQGNFNLRLKGLLPDDVGRLVDSFNLMAKRLGTAFESLETQRQETTAVINTMDEGIIKINRDGVIKLVNPAVAKLLERRVDDLKNNQIDKVLDSKEAGPWVQDALGGKTVAETFEYNRRILSLRASPIGGDKKVEGAVLVLHDVTRQKKLEQAQAEFVSNASHELNTPIASLKAYVDLLNGKTTGKANQFVKTMDNEISRLKRLVKDLLTLARLDSGQVHLTLKPHSIYEIVNEVTVITSPLANSSDIALKVELEKSLPPVICDRDRLTEVLIGLTDNALKHTSAGNTVTLTACSHNASLEIGVEDTGPGIPAKVLPKIFGRFYHYQRGEAEEGKVKSTGLGLSIAKELIEAHGSTIKVESKFGKGAKFFFQLKLAEGK